MKITFLSSIMLCLLVFVQCYSKDGFEPLGIALEAQRSKRWSNHVYVTKELNNEYSPVYVGPQEGMKDADKITTLPGQPAGASFNQYSGYVTVDPNAGRALFYYFTESPQNSSSNPLVLWLNGGPGCSSLGAGAMMELGPFRVNSDGISLSYNNYSWNNVANVLFLESPAGVGFSYSNRSSDYITGDIQTAKLSYTFLVNWLERFPEYKTRDFFISGESYAGHYAPQLAQLILQNNKITNQTIINLKGIAIGNAYVDYETENKGKFDFLWSHAIISDEIHQGIISNCDFSEGGNITDACNAYIEQAMLARGNILVSDIYAPLCESPTTFPSISGFDPCSKNYTLNYLNIPEVQKSLHANVTGLPGPWESCSDYIGTHWQDKPFTVLPTLKDLMASGISVWMYSGDTDGRVPVTTSRYSIDKLGATFKTSWYPWYYEQEVGGYAVGYHNLTFVTIRGAGHLVPSYQPARALAFFSSFLAGKLPPRY